MIEEDQICGNYHVRSGSYYKYEINDQFACIQNCPTFTRYDFEFISNSRRLALDA